MADNPKKGIVQFIKFGIVGLSNTLVNYIFYSIFVFFAMPYLLANFLSFTISVFNSFFWNNRYVFKEEVEGQRSWWKTFLKSYLSYSITGIFLTSALLWLWVSVCGISEYLAWIINIPICVPINFLLNKLWAYKS